MNKSLNEKLEQAKIELKNHRYLKKGVEVYKNVNFEIEKDQGFLGLVYIITSRHGDIENPQQTIYGNDYEVTIDGNNIIMNLSDKGIKQWEKNVSYLKDYNLTNIHVSSNLRAKQSALSMDLSSSIGIMSMNEFDEFRARSFIAKFLGKNNSLFDMKNSQSDLESFIKSEYFPWNYTLYKDTEEPGSIVNRMVKGFHNVIMNTNINNTSLIISHNISLRFLHRYIAKIIDSNVIDYPENEIAMVINKNYALEKGEMNLYTIAKYKDGSIKILNSKRIN